ncbi:MAG: hypothetical protein HPY66_3419 [Firmicutes bacterium]|nr:hypothetical protein [Bacillota bacterium]MDI6705426.1 DUF5320 domain-containing protein [Bacillota bacterium]
MPGRDGTGPMGRGAMTGRGLGFCTGINAIRYGAGLGLGLGLGLGFGYRRGFRRNYIAGPIVSKSQKELLAEQKELLQSRLNIISKMLEGLSENDK